MATEPDLRKQQRWLEQVRRWQGSGLSVRAYCLRHQLSEASFYFWKRTLQQRGLLPNISAPRSSSGRDGAASQTPLFLPVAVSAANTTPSALELVLPDGFTVRVAAGFDAATLQQLLALDDAYDKIKKFGEKNEDLGKILTKINESGNITIVNTTDMKSDGDWIGGKERKIRINVAQILEFNDPKVNKPDRVLGTLLWELLNAADDASWQKIQNDSGAGKLSRIDFVLLAEHREFGLLGLQDKIAKAGANAKAWSNDVSRFNYNPKMTFNSYIQNSIKPIPPSNFIHSADYAKSWSTGGTEKKLSYAGITWFENNPNGNADELVDRRVKEYALPDETIQALQKMLRSIKIDKK